MKLSSLPFCVIPPFWSRFRCGVSAPRMFSFPFNSHNFSLTSFFYLTPSHAKPFQDSKYHSPKRWKGGRKEGGKRRGRRRWKWRRDWKQTGRRRVSFFQPITLLRPQCHAPTLPYFDLSSSLPLLSLSISFNNPFLSRKPSKGKHQGGGVDQLWHPNIWHIYFGKILRNLFGPSVGHPHGSAIWNADG